MGNSKKNLAMPSTEAIEQELKRVRYNERYVKTFRSTVNILITVAAIAVLIATLLLPVLQIYGASMTPTLYDGELVVSVKTSEMEKGDVIAFYYNNKILVKRVIACPGEWVDIETDGTTYVNNELLSEPYVTDMAYGDTNIELPYQVPDGKLFVMGDHRSTSVDSRNTTVGCVSQEQIVGKIVLRIWPIDAFGLIR